MSNKNNDIQNFINIIYQCQKDFEKNLKNNKIMFVYRKQNKCLDFEEVFFPKTCFYHLTGLKAFYKNNKEMNSYDFYEALKSGSLNSTNTKIKNSFSFSKLEVLPRLIRIDKKADMIGNYNNSDILLKTDKLAGTQNACMGFKYNKEEDRYVPNTVLKADIREKILKEEGYKPIVAILKKNINENLYTDITYLKNNYNIQDLLENKDIAKNIDIENMFSGDRTIDEKLVDFYYDNKSIETKEDDEEDEWER